ncbi:MAG TPA: DUF86 domain-containing protein [Gemmataceae bacterium]|nr:DUF86 domain-containing protein [Gemmataceae bacterium]
MNADDVRGKLDVIAANQQQLNWLRSLSPAEFAGDTRNLDSALHRLQTTIQALLDIGAYVIGSLNLPTPQHSADIISELRDAGFIPPTPADEYLRMVAFRNRVVHLYNRIDPATVYEILQKHTSDLERLRDVLVDIILKHPDVSGAS